MDVKIRRVKRGKRYYIYAFDRKTGRILTYVKWSSDREKRAKAYQKVKAKVKEEGWKIAYVLKAEWISIKKKGKGRYGGITVRWSGKAKVKMEDGELTEFEYIEDTTLKEKFSDAVKDMFVEFVELIGLRVGKSFTNWDVKTQDIGVVGELDLERKDYMLEAEQRGDYILVKRNNLTQYQRKLLLKYCREYGVGVRYANR